MAVENTYPHHTRDRFAWLDQVLADRAIPEPAFRVAYALSSFVNRKSGAAWPSHATLAQKTGLGESTVRRASGHPTHGRPSGRRTASWPERHESISANYPAGVGCR